MPRGNKRNIVPALDEAGVDASGKGAQVSDEIQLTYQLDDIGAPLHGYFGTGINVVRQLNRHACVELSVLNPDGIIFQSATTDSVEIVGDNAQLLFAFTRRTPILMTDGVDLPIHLQGNCRPRCTARWGTVPSAQIAIGQFRFYAFGGERALQGFYVPFGIFLVFVRIEDDSTKGIGISWVERNRQPEPGYIPPFVPP